MRVHRKYTADSRQFIFNGPRTNSYANRYIIVVSPIGACSCRRGFIKRRKVKMAVGPAYPDTQRTYT